MRRIYPFFIFFAVILQSCKSDDCSDTACFTPPESFLFEIVDKTSGENVFTSGMYTAKDLEITNTLDANKRVEFMFISENNANILQIGPLGSQTEILDIQVKLSDDPIFDFFIDAKRKTEDCCSYTEYNEKTITGTAFEQDSQTGVYQILVE